MKRIQEKVKDIIEVRNYKTLHDFISDPPQTLAAYHFTDFTSDLMAKWLDKVSAIHDKTGAASALAGYRGVGKSHFLATLGAIISNLELRSRVTDPHVAASAQRLKRVRYTIAYVRRGTHETLVEELREAIAKALEIEVFTLSDSLPELLKTAAEKNGAIPFILMVDTAFERSSRVARDDGVLLGEIAEIAKKLNMFVGVALDDDIAGADGINAAIARNFSIDYLDQEHLYRIVDTNVFPKNRQMAPLLNDIYANFRQVIPKFRWSEQRFISLYPLHPVILETAPFVRLYAPEFALLGFAAEAGAKILGRPANSLIALDEVFDNVENLLRKVDDLREAFRIYDKLNTEVIAQIPVMQRLQAKLVLKALFILSLEGDGASAGEIAASILIYDEEEPLKAIDSVENLLEAFASSLGSDIQRNAESGGEVRYSLKVSSKDSLNQILSEYSKSISDDVIPNILRRTARERFADWTFGDENDGQNPGWIDSRIVWRGGLRRGRMSWNFVDSLADAAPPESSEFIDWEVIICPPGNDFAGENKTGEISKVYWQPAPLRKDETETLLRYYVLLTDTALREEYGEQLRAAGHAHHLSVEKIWNRIFLEDAKIIIEGFDYQFTEQAKSTQNLSDLFSNMLEPLFEASYPEHPYFSNTLDKTEVSALVKDFFGGARQTLAETQKLAELFALPLGLVTKYGNSYILEREENLVNLPLAREILSMLNENPEETISLKTIYSKLRRSPYGLGRETQHLILTALVAQRQIEFVTKNNDRINRRSLDLTIIWDDIAGIAKPQDSFYSTERLTEWAKLLTGSDTFRSIDAPEEIKDVRGALENWLFDWRGARVLERFDELPVEVLNTKIWRLSVHAEKTFGAVAETIGMTLNNSISLEEGVQRIADTFSDSEREFFSCGEDLVVLEDFIIGAVARREIWNYISICETTSDEKIEHLRALLIETLNKSYENPCESLNREMKDLWNTFHERFSEHFAVKHDSIMKSHYLQEQFDEIMRSDQWWEFENLTRLQIFQQTYWKEAQKTIRRFKELNCRFNVREMLRTHPFCVCSFSLAKIGEWEKLPAHLEETIESGRKSYMKALRMLSETLIPGIESFRTKNAGEEFANAARHLTDIINGAEEFDVLTNNELIILQKAFENLQPSTQIKSPANDSPRAENLQYELNN